MAVNKAKAAVDSYFQELPIPTAWGEKYNDGHKEAVIKIVEWLNLHKKTKKWLAAAASVNRTTAELIIKGTYDGRVGTYLKKLSDAIRHIDARKSIKDTPFIPSSVSRLVFASCNRGRKYKSFAILTADVGTGKTRALMEYVADNANTVLVQADPQMSPTSLMDDLIEALGIDIAGWYATREKKFKAIVKHLTGKDVLIILDEAETVNNNTLHHLRRIRDKAEIGIVLTGTNRLYELVSPKGGQFDQIRSRTCYWPKPIRGITREDCDAVALASFEDQGEVDDATLSALWHHSQGSMRMLVEDLIPAIRDYGLKNYELSADLVHKVANDVLSLG